MTANVATTSTVASARPVMSRRQFLGAAMAAAAGVLGFAVAGACPDEAQASSFDYIFPYSDVYELTPAEVQRCSAWELWIGRNEIYARHGYIFSTPELARYFSSKTWYWPRDTAATFNEGLLSYVEQRNTAIILERERAIGSPYLNGSSSSSQSRGGGYILPQSSTCQLSNADLCGLSAWELCLARNEIYARHGYSFVRDDLRRYFSAQSWYCPRYPEGRFDDSVLSYVEDCNIALIYEYERCINSPYV